MNIVYSSVRVTGISKDAARFINPSFFTGPEKGASAVYLNGNHPRIRVAYEAAGVPVFNLRDRKGLMQPLAAPEPPVAPKRRSRARRKAAE